MLPDKDVRVEVEKRVGYNQATDATKQTSQAFVDEILAAIQQVRSENAASTEQTPPTTTTGE